MEEEKYLKRQRIYKTIMLVALTAFLTVILTTMYIANKYDLGTKDSTISSLLNTSTTESDDLTKSLKYTWKMRKNYYKLP